MSCSGLHADHIDCTDDIHFLHMSDYNEWSRCFETVAMIFVILCYFVFTFFVSRFEPTFDVE